MFLLVLPIRLIWASFREKVFDGTERTAAFQTSEAGSGAPEPAKTWLVLAHISKLVLIVTLCVSEGIVTFLWLAAGSSSKRGTHLLWPRQLYACLICHGSGDLKHLNDHTGLMPR